MTRRLRSGTWAVPISIAGLAMFGLIVLYVDPMLAALAAQAQGPVARLSLAVTELGKAHWYLALIALAAAVLWACRRRADRKSAAMLSWVVGALVFLALAIAIPGLVTDILKVLVGRPRPWLHDDAPYVVFAPFGLDADHQSFPSGHATTLFAVAFGLAFFLPRLRWLLLLVAAALSLTRILLEAHYLSDIIASAALAGIATYGLRRWCARRCLVFRRGPDGRIGLRQSGIRLKLHAQQWLRGRASASGSRRVTRRGHGREPQRRDATPPSAGPGTAPSSGARRERAG